MVLRCQQQIQRKTSLELRQIDFFFEYKRIEGRAPEREHAGQRGGSALVGVIGKKWNAQKLLLRRRNSLVAHRGVVDPNTRASRKPQSKDDSLNESHFP